MMKYLFRFSMFLLLFTLPVLRLTAGWVIMEKTTSNFNTPSWQTTFLQNNKVRFETETSVAVLDLNTRQVMMIFPQYKAYWSGSADEFRKSTIAAFEQHFQQVVANAPDEDKDLYKKIYDDFEKQWKEQAADTVQPPNVKIVPTGKVDTVLTFPASEYQVVVNDTLKEFIWVTTRVSPYDEIDYQKMIDFTRTLNPFDREALITTSKAYMDIISKGMVVKSVEKHGRLEVVTEVTMVKHKDFDDAIFEPPFGYRRAGISEIMRMTIPDQTLNPDELKMDNNGTGGLK